MLRRAVDQKKIGLKELYRLADVGVGSSPSFQSSQFDHPFPGTDVNDCSNQFEGWMEKPVLF